MSTVLAIAPHPDDETLGCGGTLLRHVAEGAVVHWLIVTNVSAEAGYGSERVESRNREIDEVAAAYRFAGVHNLALLPAGLDTLPMGDVVGGVAAVFDMVRPDTVYLPYRGDIHTDHAIVFDAVASCTKWFRYGYVRRVLCYETLSETDFRLNPDLRGFTPNVFVDVADHLGEKLRIMEMFESEVGAFPFPRSGTALRALAQLRGAQSGCEAAEAFMLLKEIR